MMRCKKYLKIARSLIIPFKNSHFNYNKAKYTSIHPSISIRNSWLRQTISNVQSIFNERKVPRLFSASFEWQTRNDSFFSLLSLNDRSRLHEAINIVYYIFRETCEDFMFAWNTNRPVLRLHNLTQSPICMLPQNVDNSVPNRTTFLAWIRRIQANENLHRLRLRWKIYFLRTIRVRP